MGNKTSTLSIYERDDIIKIHRSWIRCVRTLSSEDIKEGGTMYQRLEAYFDKKKPKEHDLPPNLFPLLAQNIIYRGNKDIKTLKKINKNSWKKINNAFLETLEWGYSPLDFSNYRISWQHGFDELLSFV